MPLWRRKFSTVALLRETVDPCQSVPSSTSKTLTSSLFACEFLARKIRSGFLKAVFPSKTRCKRYPLDGRQPRLLTTFDRQLSIDGWILRFVAVLKELLALLVDFSKRGNVSVAAHLARLRPLEKLF